MAFIKSVLDNNILPSENNTAHEKRRGDKSTKYTPLNILF